MSDHAQDPTPTDTAHAARRGRVPFVTQPEAEALTTFIHSTLAGAGRSALLDAIPERLVDTFNRIYDELNLIAGGRRTPGAAPSRQRPNAPTAPADPPSVVYFIDAYASEAMIEGGTVTLDQPTHVRFGPFDEYVELTYETLRAGPDGRNIGVFDVATETWQIDELIFSDLAIAATPSGEVVAGTGVYGHGEQPTTRYPTTRY